MVKMLDTFRESPMNRTWLGLLYADSKEDISGEFEVEDLPTDYEIEWGSEVITAAGDIGQLNSEGTWVWVGDEDTAKALTLGSPKTLVDTLKKSDDISDDVEEVEEVGDVEEKVKVDNVEEEESVVKE